MKFSYSRTRTPYELIMPVRISSLEARNFLSSRAKLDTGADLTVIPERVREELKIFPGPPIRIKGSFGQLYKETRAYYIILDLEDDSEF